MDPRDQDLMAPFSSPAVAAVFAGYPPSVRNKLMRLRDLVLKTAANTPGVGPIEETLRWGEPAYRTSQSGSGSTIRMAWKKTRPSQYALYFICTTPLVDTFRSVFPGELRFEGNRAIVLELADKVPMDALAWCIAAALTYMCPPKP